MTGSKYSPGPVSRDSAVKQKEKYVKKISKYAMAISLFCLGIWSAPSMGEMVVVEDWVSIEAPATAKVGEVVTIKLKLTGIDAGMKVSCHLHYRKTDGSYAGVNKAVAAKTVPESGEVVFEIKPNAKPDLATLIPSIFVSPDGTWKSRTHKTNAAEIPVES